MQISSFARGFFQLAATGLSGEAAGLLAETDFSPIEFDELRLFGKAVARQSFSEGAYLLTLIASGQRAHERRDQDTLSARRMEMARVIRGYSGETLRKVGIVLRDVSQNLQIKDLDPQVAAQIALAAEPLSLPRGFQNKNGLIPPIGYTRGCDRVTKTVIARFFGNSFREFWSASPDDSVFFDAGGGFSLYGLEMANLGMRVTTVSPQDYYWHLLEPLTDPRIVHRALESVTPNEDGSFNAINNIGIHAFHLWGKVFGLPLSVSGLSTHFPNAWRLTSSADTAAPAFAQWVGGIVAALHTPDIREKFVRRRGFVQDVLPTLTDQSCRLIIDLCGAYYYSTGRLALLRSYYEKLEQGGRAYIMTDHLPHNEIVFPDGREISFARWLKENYPDFFDVVEENGVTEALILFRNSDGAFPPLEDILTVTRETVTPGLHFVNAQYRLR